MGNEPRRDSALAAMRRINAAWLGGRVDDLTDLLHPDIVMAFPGFAGRAAGREAFLAGFRDFCQNSRVHAYDEHAHEADVAGDTAVVTFRYEMLYERSGKRHRASGRDLWVYYWQNGCWLAVWRTMLDLDEMEA